MTQVAQNIRTSARTEVLALIEQMHRAAKTPIRVHQISDQLEMLARTYLAPTIPDPFPERTFTKTQARILARLQESEGEIVTRDQLMDAVYFDSHSEPVPKILDVFICKLRKKLAGTQYRIESVWAQGFRMSRAAEPGEMLLANLASVRKDSHY